MITWGSLGIALSVMAYMYTKRGLRGAKAYDSLVHHKK